MFIFKVQPDMEELTENAEEPDEGESKQSEIKLGKLQYKVTILIDNESSKFHSRFFIARI